MPAESAVPRLTDGEITLSPRAGGPSTPLPEAGVDFTIEVDDEPVGTTALRPAGPGTAELHWELDPAHRGHGWATRAVRLLVDYAFDALHVERVEARVRVDQERAVRVATRSGLRREGVRRAADPGGGGGDDEVVLARLATDLPITEAGGFRALLNSFLPRKRAIAQLLLRDGTGRVLLCRLTYKRDWDLPGGVVEVGESPALAVAREVEEELGLTLPVGPLLLTDWLPPWGGWDDALCLVFDGAEHDPSLLDGVVRQVREIAEVRFCTAEEVAERAADFTTRRIEAALATLGDSGGTPYTESGRALP